MPFYLGFTCSSMHFGTSKPKINAFLVASFLSLTVFTACGSKKSTVVVQGEVRKISTNGPCPILVPNDLKKGVDLECGTIISPLDKDDKNSAEIRVSYFRVFAKKKDNPRPPLVIHFGGPGDDGQGPFNWSAAKRETIGSDRDLIAIGQRGTTHSFMIPECPATYDLPDTLDAVVEVFRSDSQKCKKLFDNAGITLNAFSTTSGVRDVEALRIALGFQKISFYGVSYGTRFALEYARQFPSSVDRILIDSIYPPNKDPAESHIDEYSDIAQYLSSLRDDCNQAPACKTAFSENVPDFPAALESVMSSTAPISVISDSPKSKLSMLTLGRSMGMDANSRHIFAAMIAAGAKPSGNYNEDYLDSNFSQFLAAWRSLGIAIPSDREVMYLLMGGSGGASSGFSGGINSYLNCTEHNFTNAQVEERIADSQYSFIGPGLKSTILELAKLRSATCDAFKDESTLYMQSFGKPVVSNNLTYILNSKFDSATPIKNARLAKATLPWSGLFEFKCTAHDVLGSATEECENSIIRKALDGRLMAPSVKCVCGE